MVQMEGTKKSKKGQNLHIYIRCALKLQLILKALYKQVDNKCIRNFIVIIGKKFQSFQGWELYYVWGWVVYKFYALMISSLQDHFGVKIR